MIYENNNVVFPKTPNSFQKGKWHKNLTELPQAAH